MNVFYYFFQSMNVNFDESLLEYNFGGIMMKEIDKMLNGLLYKSNDDTLVKMHVYSREMLDKINATKFSDFEKRNTLFRNLFGSLGEMARINKPFFCDYGANIYIGDNFYANLDCLMLDVNKIIIGNNVMFGPRVSIYTATHPIDVGVRNDGLEYGLSVKVDDNVWVGGSATINPGVTIGKNSIIGSGSVVTKDIPENVIAAGNPCKVIRTINDNDKTYWESLKNTYYNQQ